MPGTRRRSAPAPLLLALLTACAGGAQETGGEAAVVDSVPAPSARESPTPAEPEEIYYDLTEFTWYREGKPLLHDRRGHLPAGVPVPLELSELAPAGSHEGVTYYQRAAGGDTLFVPVFPRYWQPFAPR
ncbi:MAG TPA: hypothetical protein VMK65_07285 [Longimicrobiales bacterium]|nr:hypothetical protein [Longimicrobiales bacterium]